MLNARYNMGTGHWKQSGAQYEERVCDQLALRELPLVTLF